MADVRPPCVGSADPDAATDHDRAQLILITGLTLAVILVAVVLVLNTVIYTENLATRGVDAGGAEAIDFRDGAVDDLGGILHREHRSRSSATGVVDGFNESAAAYGRTITDLRARDGVIANVTVDPSTAKTGYFIAQNETADGFRNMNSPDGAATDWTVASNVSQTRNYQLTVEPDSLSDSTGTAFTVVADGTTAGTNETWEASLSRGAGDNLMLEVTVGNRTETGRFEPGPDGDHTVDFTAGTVNGKPFDQLVWADGVQTGSEPDGSDPYDIRYENGDRADGTYYLVVDDRDGGADPDRSSRPYVADAVYSVEVKIRHRTPELEYADTIRLAPGERDE